MGYRYFIHLAYKGTHYHGWQIQPNSISVQEVLNKSLSTLLREEIYVIGAGRTDTGVHAPYFIAHFDSVKDNLHLQEQLIYKLNGILPRDISVYRIYLVKPEAHARFDALSRTYHYRLCQTKDPFNQEFAMHLYKSLNLGAMNQGAAILKEYTDFTSFSKLHTDVKTNNCKITEAYWQAIENEIIFTITADRFLRNMVRAIVGTLLDVGMGKITIDAVRTIIENKNRAKAGFSADAQGLHLVNILYPEEIFRP